MTVWCYWEGPMPQHIDVCLKSIKRMSGDFELVTPSNVSRFVDVGQFHENFCKTNKPAHRADCIRAMLLKERGGAWIDADTIGWMPIVDENFGVEFTYYTWTAPPRRVMNGYVYSTKGSSVSQAWLEGVNKALERENDASWTKYGEKILTPIIDGLPRVPFSIAEQGPRCTFMPVDVDIAVERYFQDERPEDVATYCTLGFGLNNSWMMHHKKREMSFPEWDWKDSKRLIHRLLHIANQANKAAGISL